VYVLRVSFRLNLFKLEDFTCLMRVLQLDRKLAEAAQRRVKAAARDKKITQLRTRNLLDQINQDRVALRMRRASLQASLTTKLIKESAAFERRYIAPHLHAWLHVYFHDCFRDVVRAWAEKQRAQLLEAERNNQASRALETCSGSAAVQVAQMKHDAEKTFHERELFLRAQQLDLKRAAKDLLSLQTRSVDALRDEIHHRESRFEGCLPAVVRERADVSQN
jgi:hypothetical protein